MSMSAIAHVMWISGPSFPTESPAALAVMTLPFAWKMNHKGFHRANSGWVSMVLLRVCT